MQVLWVISTHAGEIDYFLPLLNQLNKYKIKIRVIFLNKKVLEQFHNNSFYKECFKNFNIEYTSINFLHSKKLDNFYNLLIILLKLPFLINQILVSKKIFFEKSNSTKSSKFFSFLCNFLRKEVILYPHAVQVYQDWLPQKQKNLFKFHKVLLSHASEKNHYINKLNFFNYILIGHPYSCKDWKNFLEKKFNFKKKNQATIILGKVFGSEDKFYEEINLIVNILKKKDNNLDIILKAHPSMNIETIENKINLMNENFIKFSFTTDHVVECFVKSKFSIVVNNSSSWIAYFLKEKYLEYCNPHYMKIIDRTKTSVNLVDNNSCYKLNELENKIINFDLESNFKTLNMDEYSFNSNEFKSIFKN